MERLKISLEKEMRKHMFDVEETGWGTGCGWADPPGIIGSGRASSLGFHQDNSGESSQEAILILVGARKGMVGTTFRHGIFRVA
jgi:hypothetical protein